MQCRQTHFTRILHNILADYIYIYSNTGQFNSYVRLMKNKQC